ANLLNNYGSLQYTPNVPDLIPPVTAPPQQPLVYANWPAGSTRVPPGMPTGVPVGPFVQLDPGTRAGPPRVPPPKPALGQPSFNNQLITGPGPGGGPVVRIWSFANDALGFRPTDMAEFNPFDPTFRGGINVPIAEVVQNPVPAGNEVVAD